jgi:hypothetical protein
MRLSPKKIQVPFSIVLEANVNYSIYDGGITSSLVYNSNNSSQFVIIYVPSQQPQGQLQTQRSVDTGNYIMDKHIIIIIINP